MKTKFILALILTLAFGSFFDSRSADQTTAKNSDSQTKKIFAEQSDRQICFFSRRFTLSDRHKLHLGGQCQNQSRDQQSRQK